MTKKDFLDELSYRLRTFPPEEAQKTIAFYSEAVDDRIEDGMSEEEAVDGLGSLDDITAEAANSLPLTVLVKGRVEDAKNRASNKGLWITLAAAGSPLWLALALAAFAVGISILAALFSVAISIAAVVLALVVSGAAAVAGAFTLPYEGIAPRLIIAGVGLAAVGLGLLFVPVLAGVTKAAGKLIGLAFKKLKAAIAGRGEQR